MSARKPTTNMTLFPLDDVPANKSRAHANAKATTKTGDGSAKSKQKRAPPKRSPAHIAVETQLQRILGTKVSLVDKGGKGTITVAWHGYDHLDALMHKFGR